MRAALHRVPPTVLVTPVAVLLGLALGLSADIRLARADDAQRPVAGTSETAQATAAAADPDKWRVGFTAYGWLINMNGNATTRGQTVDVNASFIDILQKSDSLMAFMGYFEADKGRVGLYGDLVWTKLGFQRSVTSYRNPLPGLTLTLNGNAALTTALTVAEVGGLYEIHRWPGTEASFTAVDGLLGFRYWNNSVSASLDGIGTASYPALGISASRSIGVSVSNTMQWVDPVVGLRLRHQFTPAHSLLVRGDIGGFGLGSQFTWQALGAYTYRWKAGSFDLAAVLGYRALSTSYTNGSGFDATGLNLVLHGPIIGVGIRF